MDRDAGDRGVAIQTVELSEVFEPKGLLDPGSTTHKHKLEQGAASRQ